MSDPAQPSSGLMNHLRSSFSHSQPSGTGTVGIGSPVGTQSASLAVTDALEIADQVLTEVEAHAKLAQSQSPRTNSAPVAPLPAAPTLSVLPQVLPAVVQHNTDTLNPAYAGPTAKETLEASSAPDVQSVDAAAGVQYVEQEHHPEIPVEVENFIQKVDDHQAQLPTEIVIADGVMPVPQPHFPTHKVVVLPITPEVEAVGDKKDPSWSVKWLVEWSQKVMKMFTGQVIYRQN